MRNVSSLAAIYSSFFTHKHVASTLSSPSQEYFHVLGLDLKDSPLSWSQSLFFAHVGICSL